MKPTTMTGALKQAIEESGLTVLEIERATSVKRASVLRFMRGETSLRLDIADRLAAYFGLAVVKRKGK
ncbi:MAG: helix-turn-helix transcriptional regulator [Planctomycetota bacterium]